MLSINPLVISGPSAIGKTTLSNQLEEHGFRNVLKTTTREPRVGEVRGVDYEFLTVVQYESIPPKDFVMSDYFFNNHYGIRKSAVEDIIAEGFVPMLQIHTPTVRKFLNEYPNSETVFMLPMNDKILLSRLIGRGGSEEEIQQRLTKGVEEIDLYNREFRHLYKHQLEISSDNNEPHIEFIRSLYATGRGIGNPHSFGKEREQ